MISAGLLRDITDIATAEGWKDVVNPSTLLDACTVDGHIYCAPVNIHLWQWLWLSHQAFADAGVPVPTNWSDFVAAAPALEAAGKIPLAMGQQSWQITGAVNVMFAALVPNDVFMAVYGDKNAEAAAGPDVAKVFEAAAVAREIFARSTVQNWNDATNLVITGQAGGQIMGDWAQGEFAVANQTAGKDYNCPPGLAMLAKTGFKEVEGFGAQYEDPAATRALLDANRLAMPTGHFALTLVEERPAKAIGIARKLGIKAVIVPYLMPEDRPTDRAGWAAFGWRLAEAVKPIRDVGLHFGWHNHNFEFTRTADGLLPIEAIAGVPDDISLELDLAWIAVAGEDPVAWLERYKGRVIAAHVKDRAAPGQAEDEGGWADLGHGILDYGRIVRALRATGVNRWVLEHDNPKDHVRFATRSFATISKY